MAFASRHRATSPWAAGDSTHFASARATCLFGTNVYFSATGGTTGTTPPTHTTGTVSDGLLLWQFLFGLHTECPFLGASFNSVIGNVAHGNIIDDEIDNSQNPNFRIGGTHSQIRTRQNTTPQLSMTGRGGDVVFRRDTTSPHLVAYVNTGGSTPNNNLWVALQARHLGAHANRPNVGLGFDGAHWWDQDELRTVIHNGAATTPWVDFLGRSDPATGVAAAGTTITDATQLLFQHTVVSTVGAGQGCKLPLVRFAGMEMTVWNDGANPLLLYPASVANKIDGAGVGNPITIAAGDKATLKSVDSTTWRTTASAAASAGAPGAQGAPGIDGADGEQGPPGPPGSYFPGQYPARIDTSDAAAGNIAEYRSGNLASGSSVALSVSTVANVCQVTLDPGEWDLTAILLYNNVTGTGTVANVTGGMNTVNNAIPAFGDFNALTFLVNQTGNALPNNFGFITGPFRVKLAVQTVYYLNTFSFWTGSVTLNAYGTIRARRI
jgi:hypothetical protein